MDIVRYILKNHQSDEEKILYLRPDNEKDRTHFTDSETGVELEMVDSMALLEWFANNYKSFGTTLEIITDRSQEGAQFCRGFGGIGGLLRYQVDFQDLEQFDDRPHAPAAAARPGRPPPQTVVAPM